MTDIVERLLSDYCDHQCGDCDRELKIEAASEIKQLREQLKLFVEEKEHATKVMRNFGWTEEMGAIK